MARYVDDQHGHRLARLIIVQELLFLSSKAVFQPPKAIRGGVPVCLPQFAKRGPLQQHGFARNVSWELAAGSGTDGVELALDVDEKQGSEYGFDGRLSATMHVRVRCRID